MDVRLFYLKLFVFNYMCIIIWRDECAIGWREAFQLERQICFLFFLFQYAFIKVPWQISANIQSEPKPTNRKILSLFLPANTKNSVDGAVEAGNEQRDDKKDGKGRELQGERKAITRNVNSNFRRIQKTVCAFLCSVLFVHWCAGYLFNLEKHLMCECERVLSHGLIWLGREKNDIQFSTALI